MENGVIQMQGIFKQYQTGEVVTHVLKGVDFHVSPGEFIAIMGPSGAGKSTLMNIISFLDRPTTGNYVFDGISTEKFSDDELAEIRNGKIGFVFQMFNLLPNLSAMENVKLPLLYAQVPESEQNERAKAVLEQVGLGHRINNRPNQLSGGEQQRVAIARALINKPKIIFADEPTGNLDSKSASEIMDIFKHLQENEDHTIIMVTHELNIAAYARRVVTMKDGVIVEDMDAKEKFKKENGNSFK